MPVLLLAWLALAGSGCRSPIGIERVDTGEVYAELASDVLSSGRLSAGTVTLLSQMGLREEFERAPETVLLALHELVPEIRAARNLVSLAEAAYYHAMRRDDRRWYLASAFYAYRYLRSEPGPGRMGRMDVHLALALDLYDRGLAEGLRSEDGDHLDLSDGVRALPFGELRFDLDEAGLDWGPYRFDAFAPAAEYAVRGLRSRHRQPGLGVAVIGSLQKGDLRASIRAAERFVPEQTRVPATLVVHFAQDWDAVDDGRLFARGEIYAAGTKSDVQVGDERIPLSLDLTSSLAANLESSPLWNYSIRGFLRGDFEVSSEPLVMLSPYRPDRIPLVLVHGTASSLATWGQVINELSSNPVFREKYQVWLFIYNTGQPILLSSARLRNTLQEAVDALQEDGEHPLLQRMVVVGHSQGGLLTRLSVVSSGDRIWQSISDRPFDDMSLRPKNREILERALFFEPLPFVERVVFMSTPHRGSFLADRWLGRFANWLVRTPAGFVDLVSDVVAGDPVLMRRVEASAPGSVADMRTDSRFVHTLAELPFREELAINSVVAVRQPGPPEHGDDGVVRYESAHLDEAESERVVRSGHSVQLDPVGILELVRILYEHAGEDTTVLELALDAIDRLRLEDARD